MVIVSPTKYDIMHTLCILDFLLKFRSLYDCNDPSKRIEGLISSTIRQSEEGFTRCIPEIQKLNHHLKIRYKGDRSTDIVSILHLPLFVAESRALQGRYRPLRRLR